ncbi:sensor histidine kinase [Actinoplanes sp. GCM10030250]|uniref:sensor histidine kinase n=1 Tax=Actinoplanes sp. GCM10030250 TaxID=3273376 RepID=UPI003623076B
MLRSPIPRLTAMWRAGSTTVWADLLLVLFLTLAAVALTGERGDAPGPPSMILWPPPEGMPAGAHFAAEEEPAQAALFAMNLLITAPLLGRRRWPLLCWVAQFAGFLLVDIEGNLANLSALLIGAYSLAVHGRSVALSMGALFTAGAIITANDTNTWPNLPDWSGAFVILVPIGLLGVAIRAARSRALASEQRAQALEREQHAATRLAVAEERARIARELHDVVSHHVSVMTIQAGAAGKVLDAQPDMAREALSAVESSGRETMAELRHLLGVLAPGPEDAPPHPRPATQDDPPHPRPATQDDPSRPWLDPHDDRPRQMPGPAEDLLHPQPGLGQLATLVDNVRRAGQPVTLSAIPIDLPHGSGLAAYRVVQEALTNALRHAPGARTTVTVAAEPTPTGRDLVITVENDAPPPGARPAEPSAGTGLLGLAERLRIYDGTLRSGRRVGGGFQVHARLPLTAADDPSGRNETDRRTIVNGGST